MICDLFDSSPLGGLRGLSKPSSSTASAERTSAKASSTESASEASAMEGATTAMAEDEGTSE